MRAEGVLGMILPKDRDPRFVTIRRGGTLTDADHQLLALWAALCAEHVLDLFESARPLDPRPRRAIEHARAWARGEVTMTQAREAAGHAMAAGRRLRGAARHAAYAAGQAAVVAHVAAHELGAAGDAVKAARAAAPPGGGEGAGQPGMPHMLLAKQQSSGTSPRTSWVRPPMRSRPHVLPPRKERPRAQGGSSAGGSAISSRRRFASSSSTSSGCATTSVGRCSTADRLQVPRSTARKAAGKQ